MRQKHASTPEVGKLTVEQVRDAINVWLDAAELPRAARKRRYQKALNKIRHRGKIPLDLASGLLLEHVEDDVYESGEPLWEVLQAFRLPRQPDQ